MSNARSLLLSLALLGTFMLGCGANDAPAGEAHAELASSRTELSNADATCGESIEFEDIFSCPTACRHDGYTSYRLEGSTCICCRAPQKPQRTCADLGSIFGCPGACRQKGYTSAELIDGSCICCK
jgi:hypothetical protein